MTATDRTRRNDVASRRRPRQGRRFAARFARPCRAALDRNRGPSLPSSQGLRTSATPASSSPPNTGKRWTRSSWR